MPTLSAPTGAERAGGVDAPPALPPLARKGQGRGERRAAPSGSSGRDKHNLTHTHTCPAAEPSGKGASEAGEASARKGCLCPTHGPFQGCPRLAAVEGAQIPEQVGPGPPSAQARKGSPGRPGRSPPRQARPRGLGALSPGGLGGGGWSSKQSRASVQQLNK